MFVQALLAKTVAKIGVGPFADIDLKRLPLIVFIADFLAMCADGEDSLEDFDLSQGVLKLENKLLALLLHAVALRDVPHDKKPANHTPMFLHAGNVCLQQ